MGSRLARLLELVRGGAAPDLLKSEKLWRDYTRGVERFRFRDLKDLQRGMVEGLRFYVQLKRQGVPIACLDIGGGLGIDYEGTKSNRLNSMNYSVAEYSQLVVSTANTICAEAAVEAPHIISESGRAMTAHHAMLVTNIIDVENPIGQNIDAGSLRGRHNLIDAYLELLTDCDASSIDESYRECVRLYQAARLEFGNGDIDLQQWADIDELYYALLKKLDTLNNDDDALSNELGEKLASKYFANFSLFQSMPDTWAIDQVFPIVPLQRLLEKPAHRCTLQDLTCDSDGRVDFYVDGEGIETSLPIHAINEDERYLVGIFLLGAYQEILGDIHNLFGDSASVNVSISEDGELALSELDFGDKVVDLFQTIHIDPDRLRQRYKHLINDTSISDEEKNRLLEQLLHGLDGYTYLEED